MYTVYNSLIDVGRTFYDLGRYDKAIEYYDKAIEIHPRCGIAWCQKGVALNASRQYYEAMKCAKKATEISPSDIHAYIIIGGSYYGLGNYNEAISYFNKALEIDPKNTIAINGRAKTRDMLDRINTVSRNQQPAPPKQQNPNPYSDKEWSNMCEQFRNNQASNTMRRFYEARR